MSKKGLFVTFVVMMSVLFVGLGTVSASDNPNYEFNIKAVKKIGLIGKAFEKVNLFFRFSPASKSEYLRKVADKRLAELIMVVEKDDKGLFQEVSSRYSSYLGNYSDYIVSKGLTDQKQISKQLFEKHKEILLPLRDKYEYNSAWWLFLQQNIDITDILAKQVDDGL